jgi:cephalosporin hydroxylase
MFRKRPSPDPAPVSDAPAAQIVDAFHRLYYEHNDGATTWRDTYWMGVPTRKCPLDLWVYQEILHERRPTLIIECGTAFGGSALYLAHLCDILNCGRVATIDIDITSYGERPQHPRIRYLTGSSVDDSIIAGLREQITDRDRVMVILDSDHSRDHVLAELRAYSRLVTAGDYLIVEDTSVNGHPVFADFGPGPMEALDDFLAENHDFDIDASREKLLLTFNPRGYLRRR